MLSRRSRRLRVPAAAAVAAATAIVLTATPASSSTVTVGRADPTTGTTGAVVEATDVIVHPERNVALLKLSPEGSPRPTGVLRSYGSTSLPAPSARRSEPKGGVK